MSDHIPLAIDLQQQLTTEQAWHYAVVPKLAHNGTLELYVDESSWKHGLEEELEVQIFERKTSDGGIIGWNVTPPIPGAPRPWLSRARSISIGPPRARSPQPQ